MVHSFQHHWSLWLLLLIPLFLLGLASFPVIIIDEARNAQAAWEMYQNGEWIVPTFNENLRADKPPLHYWGMRIFYAIGGKSGLTARLGSALCGLTACWLLYQTGRRNWSDRAGYLAAGVYGLSLYVPLQFHLATPDPYLALGFLAAMLALWRGVRDEQAKWVYLGYFLLGVTTLAKGPIAPALAGGSWAIYLSLSHTWRKHFWSLRPLRGVLLWAVVAAPWFIVVHFQTGGAFTESFFFDHNFGRFLKTKEGHGGPFWLIPAFLIAGALPGSLWALRRSVSDPTGLLRFSWAVVLFVGLFFGLSSTKLPSYSFPAFAFLALAGGYQLDNWLAESKGLSWRGIVAGVVLSLLPLGVWLGLRQDRVLAPEANTWPLFLLPAGFGLIALWMSFRQAKRTRLLLTLGVGYYLFHLLVLAWFLPRLNSYSQVENSLDLLQQAPEVIALGRFQPAHVFRLDQTIPSTDSTGGLRQMLQNAPDSTLVITAERYRERLPQDLDLELVFKQKDLFEYPTTLIYRYHAE